MIPSLLYAIIMASINILVEIKGLFSKLSSQLNSSNGQDYDPDLLKQIEKSLDRLCEEIYANKKEINTAFEKIDSLQVQITEQGQRITQLIQYIETKIKAFEPNEFILKLGQLAFDVEKKLTRAVLHDIIEPKQHVSTISVMTKAINNTDHFDVFQNNEKGRTEAKDRWEKIKNKFGLNDPLFRYIDELKQNYIPITHPKQYVDNIRDALAGDTMNLPPDLVDKSLLLKLLDIYNAHDI